jgi:hypothetical protein
LLSRRLFARSAVVEKIIRSSSRLKTITTAMSGFSACANAGIHAATICSSRMIRRSYAQHESRRKSNSMSLSGKCSRCKVPLTLENARPSIVHRGSSYCNVCFLFYRRQRAATIRTELGETNCWISQKHARRQLQRIKEEMRRISNEERFDRLFNSFLDFARSTKMSGSPFEEKISVVVLSVEPIWARICQSDARWAGFTDSEIADANRFQSVIEARL